MLCVLIAFNFNYNPIKLDDYFEGDFQFYCVATIKYASGTEKEKQENEEENEIGNLINKIEKFHSTTVRYTHADKNI